MTPVLSAVPSVVITHELPTRTQFLISPYRCVTTEPRVLLARDHSPHTKASPASATPAAPLSSPLVWRTAHASTARPATAAASVVAPAIRAHSGHDARHRRLS